MACRRQDVGRAALLVAMVTVLLVPGPGQCFSATRCPAPCTCMSDTVYCNGTGLDAVPPDIPLDTYSLNLADNHIRSLTRGALGSLNKLSFLDISGNGLVDGAIHEGSLSLPNLTHVTCDFNRFSRVPKELPRQLVALSLNQNNITSLASDSFIDNPSLTYLSISSNNMADIEETAFYPLSNLIALYVDFNNLTGSGWPKTALSKNSKLQILIANYNMLSSIPPNLPPSLIRLDLEGNKIATVTASDLSPLTGLITLDLARCSISHIADNAFQGLDNLVLLELFGNQLSAVTQATFVGLTGLQSLYLAKNSISAIDIAAFHSLTRLSTLDLSDNKLTTVQTAVLDSPSLSGLSRVYLSENYWICDCHLRWLREKMDTTANNSYIIVDSANMKCSGPRRLQGQYWKYLQASDFIC